MENNCHWNMTMLFLSPHCTNSGHSCHSSDWLQTTCTWGLMQVALYLSNVVEEVWNWGIGHHIRVQDGKHVLEHKLRLSQGALIPVCSTRKSVTFDALSGVAMKGRPEISKTRAASKTQGEPYSSLLSDGRAWTNCSPVEKSGAPVCLP